MIRAWLIREAWEGLPERVTAPYGYGRAVLVGSRVRRVKHPAGTCVDHDVRLNTSKRPIVHQYREGKVKRTPGGE